MPDLLSDRWSDSDSSQDARDVEMDIVPEDSDEDWADQYQEMTPLPTTAPQATDRRARVEEEVELPPSQSNPVSGGSQPSPTMPRPSSTQRGHDTPTDSHPQSTQPPRPGVRGQRFPHPIFLNEAGQPVSIHPEALPHFFGHFGPGTPQPQTRTPQPGQHPNQPGENHGQPDGTEQVPPFWGNDLDRAWVALPPFVTHGPGPQLPSDGPEPNPDARTFFAGQFQALFGSEPLEEKEDPDRAAKLVNGLERVPVGLVKRMMRVDGVPGAHEDSTGALSGETPGCAICWDTLLPGEPYEDSKLQIDPISSLESKHPTEGHDSEPTFSSSAPDDHTLDAIICLPCSHVFHTSCLIPWFSKPKHTTCPTCRFDIDPRNLTYTPPQWPPRSMPAQPVPNPTTTVDVPPAPPPALHPERDHEDLLHLDPLPDDGREAERDHHPPVHPNPPVPHLDSLVAQLLQGPIFELLANQERRVFGPPPPPGHPTHNAGATAADDPQDRDNRLQPTPLPGIPLGGTGHAHFQVPEFTAHVAFHVPRGEGLDRETVTRAARDQALNLLRSLARFVGGQTTGPGPDLGGANPEPEIPGDWAPPSAPGPTLRQRVETKERKAGLRCDDPSCGIGPSDEVPYPEAFYNPDSSSIKRVAIMQDGGDDAVCGHIFHPACLVSADRCAGWGKEARPSEGANDGYEVVSCPVCRVVGKVQKELWDEGAKELLN